MVTDDMVAVRTLQSIWGHGAALGRRDMAAGSSRARQTGPCPLASHMDRGGVWEGHRNHSRTKDEETDGHGSRKVLGKPWEFTRRRGPGVSVWAQVLGPLESPYLLQPSASKSKMWGKEGVCHGNIV